jgi:hypothetical protein
MQTLPPVCLQVAQCLGRATLEDDERFNPRTPAMNELHSLQQNGTAEDEGIAQGVIQRESQCTGRKKKYAFVAVPTQPRQPKYGGFLGIETEFVEPLRLGRPSLYVPLHLITVEAMPRYICSSHSIVRNDVKILSVRRSTSASRRTLVLHP